MRVTFEFTSKRICLPNCCLLLWLGLTLILSMDFTQVSAYITSSEGNPAEAYTAIEDDTTSIECQMNRTYFNDNSSSCLSFYREDSNIPIPKEKIHVINENSIVLDLHNYVTEHTCKYNSKEVPSKSIDIGTSVTDFKCHDYDYSKMICRFTVPESKMHTDYRLSYKYAKKDFCKRNDEKGLQKSEIICTLTGESYRLVNNIYKLNLTASNELGSLTQLIKIDHHSCVVPAVPKVSVKILKADSVTLCWTVNNSLVFDNYADGLQYEIRWGSEKLENVMNGVLPKTKEGGYEDMIESLCPNHQYEFSVRVKAVRSNNSDETMWSDPFNGTFHTKPTRIQISKCVTDFKCHDYDYSKMICKFTVPESKIHTEYRLSYTYAIEDFCKRNDEKGLQKSEIICTLTGENYRLANKIYEFNLTASNELGSLTQIIKIDHHSYVVPAVPKVSVKILKADSVTLCWTVNNSVVFDNNTDGLQYEIRWGSEKLENVMNGVLPKMKEGGYEDIIESLCPNHQYEFSVRVKAVRSNNSDETMWSDPFNGTFHTKPARPARAPNVDVGSFSIDPTRTNITLYWEELAEDEQNGPGFAYNFPEVRCEGKLIKGSLLTMDGKSAAIFRYNNTSHCTFKLESQNEIGTSVNSSVFEIYPRTEISKQEITKIYHPQNYTYTIIWKQPTDFNNLRNLTLFSCEAKLEWERDCAKNFRFETLNKTLLNYTKVTEPGKKLNFALSENYESYSTGMLWADCSTNYEPNKKNIKLVNNITFDSTIQLQWVAECWYSAIFKDYKYNLTYCMVGGTVEKECIAESKTVHIPIMNNSYIIKGLQPSTSYKIWIRMFSQDNEGPSTEAVYETKAEYNNTKLRIAIVFSVVFSVLSLCALIKKYIDYDIKPILPDGLLDLNIKNPTTKSVGVLGKTLEKDVRNLIIRNGYINMRRTKHGLEPLSHVNMRRTKHGLEPLSPVNEGIVTRKSSLDSIESQNNSSAAEMQHLNNVCIEPNICSSQQDEEHEILLPSCSDGCSGWQQLKTQNSKSFSPVNEEIWTQSTNLGSKESQNNSFKMQPLENVYVQPWEFKNICMKPQDENVIGINDGYLDMQQVESGTSKLLTRANQEDIVTQRTNLESTENQNNSFGRQHLEDGCIQPSQNTNRSMELQDENVTDGYLNMQRGISKLLPRANQEDIVTQRTNLESTENQNSSFQKQPSENGYVQPWEFKNICMKPQDENFNTNKKSSSNIIELVFMPPSEGYLPIKNATNGYVGSDPADLSNELKSESIPKKQLLDMIQSFKFLLFFVIAMCLATSPVSANDYVGEVIPENVELPIGGSVNITCRMNRSYFNDYNSSCLSFFRDEGNVSVSKEHIHVVDDSSIVFMVRNATEQKAQYFCRCHDKGVYISNVFVGTPPTNVTDFQCLGYDFSYMTCNFTVPPNKVYTDYKLKFSSSSPDYIYTCNLENGRSPSVRICNITMDNSNYRIVYQYYNFELTASNSLGTLTQSIMIDQYNRIVPAKPIVEVGNLTTNSVTLYWMVNKFSQYTHTDGLQYEIRLRPEKFEWFHINTNTVVQKNKEHFKAEINNLQYPYRRYDFSVRVKTVRANSSDEAMWSEPFNGFFYTKPTRPERAPNMDVGSFYIDSNEQNIRVYWEQLEEYEENGPDFLYNITEVRCNGTLINELPYHMDSTSATYKWDKFSRYQFKLQSQNEVGKSLNTSTLEVHRSLRPQQIEKIRVITKVYHNQTYTITWRQPSDIDYLRNFTLFWCISRMESQSECKGTIHFKHFDKYTTNHTTEPQNHTLNFAVSANYYDYSTGMMWAMCTADGETDLSKMDPRTSPISSNSIKVEWSTECLYKGILEGYNLTYCKVENETIGDCIDTTEKTISISKLVKEHIITELDPFTTYKISILMYSKLKIGPMSNPVIETTTEDAPSPPRKLKKYNITSDSVTLSWLPPKHSNGNLQYYTIWYNNEGTIVNSTSNDGNEITFKLGDLSSFSDYKVYVTAHTVKSSGPSNDIHFKTLIGRPSAPLSFIMNRNDKELFFSWSPPKLPSGRVEFYEIRVMVRKNNESETLKTSRVVGHVCKMNIPCYDPNNSYIFDVRAVNLAERSEVDYHTFSKRDTTYFNTFHQGGTKKRRHSNAEINASIGAPYQIHETTEKNIRHRYERENLKLIQTTEPSYVTQIYSQIPDEEENNEDFICLGGEKETLKIFRQYKDPSQYKLFYSPWQNGPFFACSETKFSKLTMLALIVIVVTMMLLAAVYYARKKYNKMSNIGLVIPEGLDDNINVSKGVDNKIERDEIIRSGELFYEKENHRLLSKVGNDSGFLNSVHCLDKSSAYTCSDLQDSEKSSQSTDSVELNDITSCSYTSSPSHSPNANIREISIPEERLNPPLLQPSVQLRPSENGYVKPIMMSNGYVQPQAFQNLQPKETPSFNGYTTLDAMGKPVFPQTSTASLAPVAVERNSYEIAGPKNVNNKDVAIPHPVSGNICGYVTHKQLSDFGRLQ